MRRKVGDLAPEPGFHEEQVRAVVDAEVGVAADGQGGAGQTVGRARDGIDQPPVEGVKLEVVEVGR